VPGRPAAPITASAGAAVPSGVASRATKPLDQLDAAGAGGAAGAAAWWRRLPWWLPVALLVGLAIAGLPRVLGLVLRRRRWRRTSTGRPASEVAWDDLAGRLGDLGLGWTWSWTPRAALHRLITEHRLSGPAAEALTRLSGALEAERYAPPGRPVRTDGLRQDVDVVISTVAAGLPRRARWRAEWWPRSVWSWLAGSGRQASDRTTSWVDDVEGQVGRWTRRISR